MGEGNYLKLLVPEEHYLPVLAFLGSGAKATQAVPDHEIDRLGEALRSAEEQNNEQARLIGVLRQDLSEAEEQSSARGAMVARQAERIRTLEARNAELIGQIAGERGEHTRLLQTYEQEIARLSQQLLDVLPTKVEEAAPEESLPAETASAPEPTAQQEAAPEPVVPTAEPEAAPEPEPTRQVAATYEERGVKAAATELAKLAGPVGEFLAIHTGPAGPADFIPSPKLRELYAEWAKVSGKPQVNDRQFGMGMSAAGISKKQSQRKLPEYGNTKPILYYGIKLKTEKPEPEPEDPKARNAKQVKELRQFLKQNRTTREVEVQVDEATTPYIAPKPKPKPEKQPILAVRNADARPKLSDYSQVRVIKADGAVTYVDAMDWIDPDEDTEPIKPEDADRVTFDLWTDVKDGMRDRPLGYLPDVLALEGVNTEELEQTVKHPVHVEIRPETKSKGYPVLGFRRGDIKAIVGFRDQTKPCVIAAYWDSLLTPDKHVVYRHGGGGAKKQTGLPTTVKQAVTQLKRRGFTIPDAWEKATQPVEVCYDGQTLGKMKVHLANKQQVQGDYQRLLRQAHAIDRRKGLVSV